MVFSTPKKIEIVPPTIITFWASSPLLCPSPHIQAMLSMAAPIINKTRPVAQHVLHILCPSESGEYAMARDDAILSTPAAHMTNLRSLLSNSQHSFRIPMRKHRSPHPNANPQALPTWPSYQSPRVVIVLSEILQNKSVVNRNGIGDWLNMRLDEEHLRCCCMYNKT